MGHMQRAEAREEQKRIREKVRRLCRSRSGDHHGSSLHARGEHRFAQPAGESMLCGKSVGLAWLILGNNLLD